MDSHCSLLVTYVSLWGIIGVLALDNASSLLFCGMKFFSGRSAVPLPWAESPIFQVTLLVYGAFSFPLYCSLPFTALQLGLDSMLPVFILLIQSVVSAQGLFLFFNKLVGKYSWTSFTFFPSKEFDPNLECSNWGPHTYQGHGWTGISCRCH